MGNCFAKWLLCDDFEEAVQCVIEVLHQERFAVVSEIDMRRLLGGELHRNFHNCRILSVQTSGSIHKAPAITDRSGTALPWKVLVQEVKEGRIEVTVVDPVEYAVPGPSTEHGQYYVRNRLLRVIERL